MQKGQQWRGAMQAIRALFDFRTAEHRNWFFLAISLLVGTIFLGFYLDPKNAVGFTRVTSILFGFLHFMCTVGALYDCEFRNSVSV